MVFGRAWRPLAAARSWRRAARTGASGSVRDRHAHSVVIERLKRRSDFRAAARGMRVSGRAFAVQALCRAEDGPVRVGFTVSKQVGNAVERNRVRRRLREVVRLSAAANADHMRAGHDYVLIGRRAALAAAFGDMMQELDGALARVNAAGHDAAGHQGTGGARPDPLHEASSPSPPPRPRRGRRKPPKKAAQSPAEPKNSRRKSAE
jgi:ribonuclease P protein component